MAPAPQSRPDLEALVGVRFGDRALLQRAFVHRSFLNENPGYTGGCNERLEFLGDAFLGYAVAAELFRRWPDASEGDLTKGRAALVQRDTLAAIARERGWGAALVLGQGEEARGGRGRTSILANAYEAIVGAVLLDRGEDAARTFVLDTLAPALHRLEQGAPDTDAKSQLQELCQAHRWETPQYQVLAEEGPAHARRYRVRVLVQGRAVGEGEGTSKQRAEKAAALVALERLRAEALEAPASA